MGIKSHTQDCSGEKVDIVRELHKNMDSTREKMEKETLIFIEATKSFTLEWIQRELELNTLPMGKDVYPRNKDTDKKKPDKMSHLKEMNSGIPLIVEENLNRDEYWAHRDQLLQNDVFRDYLEFKKDKMKKGLTSSVRMILGCAAEIFADLKDEAPGDRIWVKERGRRKYICILRFSDEMTASLDRYFTMLEELLILGNEMKEIEKRTQARENKKGR
ncbi:hypothetical protein MSSIT_0177 [Methanosarcina siciliae T4/M]|uniref:Uncharacterized protein n=1 Tax=Methanosarcina siciliae T4/M TaxID=1434120 RepID=A0A0E3L7J8_9EURY|nr:hypothetical protein [Methanosarcina siciliae]AKB26896.1 hypothetical protein MSSIT_0177 [Methanosarcina siciliae T4/M]